MSETNRFRLVFRGVSRSADIRRLVGYFRREVGVPEADVRKILADPPRVVRDYESRSEAGQVHDDLFDLGCRVDLEELVSFPGVSVSLSESIEAIIKKDMSKILRSKSTLAIIFIEVLSKNPEDTVPSMLGKTGKWLEGFFRESDTVLSIDDNHMLMLCFATDDNGVETVSLRIMQSLREKLGDRVELRTGYSLFPHEARTLADLLVIAEERLGIHIGAHVAMEDAAKPKAWNRRIQTVTENEESPIELCFRKARGRVFDRLVHMDSQTLWMGLSRLPVDQRKDFLYRMPFDSVVTREVKEMIEKSVGITPNPDVERHFEAIVHQIALPKVIRERNKNFTEIINKLSTVEDLPTLPSIATRIFQIAADPESSAGELSRLIQNDPSLTSKLLRTVNSAFYGSVQKIGTVKQAVVLLGTEEIIDLAFGLAAAKVFDIETEKAFLKPIDLWKHSIATGLIAQHFCRRFPELQSLGVFTAGLLHDFGKIFFIEHFSGQYNALYKEAVKFGLPINDLEEERFGISHAEVGKRLSANWNLPESLTQAIACHHRPNSAGTGEDMAALVGFADYLNHCVSTEGDENEHSEDATATLSYGHLRILSRLFGNLNREVMVQLRLEAKRIAKQSGDLLKTLH